MSDGLLFCWCHPRQSCSDLQFLGKTGINKDSVAGGVFVLFVLFSSPVTRATRMGLLLHCALLLSFSTFTAGLDFQPGSKPFGQSVFVKRSNTEEKAAKIVKRSLPAWLASSPHHKIKRRSTEQGDSCKALQGFDTKLADNTHRVSYQPKVLLHFARLTIKRAESRRWCAGANQVHEQA